MLCFRCIEALSLVIMSISPCSIVNLVLRNPLLAVIHLQPVLMIKLGSMIAPALSAELWLVVARL